MITFIINNYLTLNNSFNLLQSIFNIDVNYINSLAQIVRVRGVSYERVKT